MKPPDDKGHVDLVLHDKTGALLMLNKEERTLVRELLLMAKNSEPIRAYITKRLGEKYVEIGKKLLESLGVPPQ